MDLLEIKSLLVEGVAKYGLKDAQVDQLTQYLVLLNKWNKTYNLTAIRDPKEMVRLHLLDSLSVLPYVKERCNAGSVLDVGAGAGLPSIPLAICFPERNIYAVDKVQKKTSFMQQVKAELGLRNFNAKHGRVEKLTHADFGGEPLSVIVSRAFSEMSLFVSLTKHLVDPAGCWLAMKGVMPAEELRELESLGGYSSKVTPLVVDGVDVERHLVEIRLAGK